MEIFIIIGGMILFVLTLFLLLEWSDLSLNFKAITFGVITFYFVTIAVWLGNTERTTEPVIIHTAITDDVEWKYYVTEDGDITPISNNVKEVFKHNQRAGILEKPSYILVYD